MRNPSRQTIEIDKHASLRSGSIMDSPVDGDLKLPQVQIAVKNF